MDKIRIGLIGCGKQAPKHVRGLSKIPGLEVVLADSQQPAAEQLACDTGLPWVRSVAEIFSDPTIRAVDICTPTPSHTPLIKSAIESGKDFFCEKPLCDGSEDARVIAKLVRERRRIGMVGFVYRFAPVFEMGKRLLQGVPETGESLGLGRVVSALFRLGGRGSHQVWKHRKNAGGGAINEMLVHMLDLALWYFGEPESAKILHKDILRPKRIIQGREEQVDAEDYVITRLWAKCGVEILCQADLVTPVFTQFVEIQGENGTFMGSIQPDMLSFIHCDKPAAGYEAGKTMLAFGKRNLFEVQMAAFIQAVKTQVPPALCTIDDSVQLLSTLEILKRTAK